jgi:DNA-binding NtrC family response regulator
MLQAGRPPTKAVDVLVVGGAEQERKRLRDICTRTSWNLHEAPTISDSLAILASRAIGVVLCEPDLPDGDGKKLVQDVTCGAHAPPVIVFSYAPDERLGTEVMSLGGFDILPIPFEKSEVIRTVGQAWRNWIWATPAGPESDRFIRQSFP